MSIILQVGVKVLLKNSSGEYLLLKRSAKKYPEVNNLWDIAGGRIDPGIPLLDNLKREVQEETKLRLASEPQLIAAQDILKNTDRHIVRLTYVCETTGDPTLSGEHEEYKWLNLEQVKNLKGLDSYLKKILDLLT